QPPLRMSSASDSRTEMSSSMTNTVAFAPRSVPASPVSSRTRSNGLCATLASMWISSFCAGSLARESELPEPTVELHPRYSELLCRPHLVPSGVPHRVFDRESLEDAEIGAARSFGILPDAKGQVPGIDDISITHDRRALEHVPQLADIPGPVVAA